MTHSASSARQSGKPDCIEWIRKRSGEIVRFELERLAQSFVCAAQDVGKPMPHELAIELAGMVTYFIATHLPGKIPGSDEVAEWVEKALRETGHEQLAQSYREYEERKLRARRELPVDSPEEQAGQPGRRAAYWDKARLVQSLRLHLNLELETARQVASQVEKVVLAGKFSRLSTELIRELVNIALSERGLGLRLTPSDQVRVGTADMKRELLQSGTPSAANRAVTQTVWRQFSLSEVVSRDVAEAQHRGTLHVGGLESPATLATTCINCSDLVRSSESTQASIARLGTRLSLSATVSSSFIALDLVEPWLALVAEPHESPAKLTDRFWQELGSRLQHTELGCVLNMYGGFPSRMSLDMGTGPLFGWQPDAGQQAFAAAVAEEILGRFRRDAPDWPRLRLNWHWHGAEQPVPESVMRQIVRLAAEGHRVAMAFDRTPVPLGEGLYRTGDSVRPVLQYIGISLPTIWREADSPRTLTSIEADVASAVRLAVRAATQGREFLRRLPIPLDPAWIDQAALGVVPIGLDWVVNQVLGLSFAEDDSAVRLAESLVRLLHRTLRREARHFALGVVIDGEPEESADRLPGKEDQAAESIKGLTPLASRAGPRQQIHTTGRLHALTRTGTLICSPPSGSRRNHDELRGLIDWASHDSQLVRFQLAPVRSSVAQSTVRWPES